ncbi:MAG: Type 1 glutamine amidotransferase-like domain-containing protein, partial [Nanoarchaeota archaeon]|nr:Type 1 glutamine amidotransferase-like domain-containing protein [Nanoarchaeota archaeon]
IFPKNYGKKLGCKTDVLFLIKKKLSKKEIQKKILSSDLIYVGGGNTLKMMRIWRRLGVDKLLKKACNKGIVLSGLSAGSICWFSYGHSDSMSFYNPKSWKYIKVKGLGFIESIHCPHFNGKTLGKSRKRDFARFMKKHSSIGLGIDNCCAVEFVDNKYRVISSKKNANAYKVYKKKGKIIIKKIEKKKEYTPIETLIKR